jgi:arginase family enzyme
MDTPEGQGAYPREQLSGMQARERLRGVESRRYKEWVERSLDLGLEAAPSVNDRDISLFSRAHDPMFAGINTFLKAPYAENIREVGGYDVAVVGAPFDMGTTYRSGARFGPQAVRKISALYDWYSPDFGMDLLDEITLCDAGDIFVIPSNIEKTFDQIDRAVSFIHGEGAFPIIIGGDHSIGYPDVRALAPHIDGRLGIIHFDRHIDTAVRTMDERMHTTHWSHATDLPNVPPSNLVQLCIGGWIGNRAGVKVASERDTTVISMFDFEALGVEKAMEIALEVAWKDADAVFLSFDIDAIDPGFAPRHRDARARRAAAPRGPQGGPHGRPGRALRHGPGRDRAALRRPRHDRPARRPHHHGRPGHPGRRRPPGKEITLVVTLT